MNKKKYCYECGVPLKNGEYDICSKCGLEGKGGTVASTTNATKIPKNRRKTVDDE